MTPDRLVEGQSRYSMSYSVSSFAIRLIVGLGATLLLAACATPVYLGDSDEIPVGSRVDFWVYHDDHGWVESNIHIAHLPRVMTGAEAREWADRVGRRDAGMRWTQYYLLVTHPKPPYRQYRSSVYPMVPGVVADTK